MFLYNNQNPYKCRYICDMKILPHSLRQGQERSREKAACKKTTLELEQILLSDTTYSTKEAYLYRLQKVSEINMLALTVQ